MIKEKDMSEILSLLGEMESFTPGEDAMSSLVSLYDEENELSDADLSLVAAARAPMSFAEFMKKAAEKGKA